MPTAQDRAVKRLQQSELIHTAVLALEVDGRITPEAVLDAASDPSSPLHNQFEWNDSVAGHAYRLDQARQVIRSVQVSVTTENRVISTVHYVRDPAMESEDQGYVSVDKLRTEPENARAMIEVEFARAASFMRRARDLADALGMRGEVEAVIQHIEEVRRKAA